MRKITQFILFIIILSGCSNNIITEFPYPPIIYDRTSETALCLDKQGKAYTIDWIRGGGYDIQAIPIGEVMSIGPSLVVSKDRELKTMDILKSKNSTELKFDKDIAKCNSDVILYQDGSLGFTLLDVTGSEVAQKIPFSVYKIDLSSFPPLKDFVLGRSKDNTFLLGLATDGTAYIAGGHDTKNKSEILKDHNEYISKAVQVDGLSSIKRIGFSKKDNGRYKSNVAIHTVSENGDVKYWVIESDDLSIKKLDKRAEAILGDRIKTTDGKVLQIFIGRDSIVTKPITDLPLPNALALILQEKIKSRSIGINGDGKLVVGRNDIVNGQMVMAMTVIDSIDVSLKYWN